MCDVSDAWDCLLKFDGLSISSVDNQVLYIHFEKASEIPQGKESRAH